MTDIAIVQASFGDPAEAALVARKLLEERLAACTSLMPVTSIYRWQDVTQEAAETVMTAKTTIELASQVAARIGQLHSYDLPVIERWPVAVDEAVAAWVRDTTG
ncbi:divalent-cation tolerance protein CutA [Sphingomonas pruni]|jgi:periplasmic divalent cation tolerance protein|uniref:divalent-cation tolerance protein CutA n=1 Tax=Sphingomonas pruni TaxID=40683 RepID=UPI000829B709|nr:divalent-cation tolerance protein CutA [Sphingomonas pruni]